MPPRSRAEWKWDGIRVQLVARPAGRRMYSRGAEDMSGAFPDIVEVMDFHAVLDGELLVMRDGEVAPFADLQQRLDRKGPGAKMLKRISRCASGCTTCCSTASEDLRALPFDERRARLEAWYRATSRGGWICRR